MALASDDNNPDFVGAYNPDSRLHVRFYSRPMPNAVKTQSEGRPIFEDVVFVEIHTPGNQLNIIDTPARDEHRARFPLQWAHWTNTHAGDPAKVGTVLEQWPILTPAQVEMLKAVKFYTVEMVAFASDDQINAIGMLAGMSPFAFRDRAKTFLSVAKDASFAQKQAEELKKRDAKMADLEKQIAEMQTLLSQATQPQSKAREAKAA